MSDLDALSHDRRNSAVVLDRLAASLGCSIEAFSDQAPHELSQTLELLNLWLAIESPQDRAKALSVLRSAAAKARTPGEAVSLAHAMHEPD